MPETIYELELEVNALNENIENIREEMAKPVDEKKMNGLRNELRHILTRRNEADNAMIAITARKDYIGDFPDFPKGLPITADALEYRGGKSSGRARSKKAHTKNPLPSSTWVSTGRQTTLKDGSKRTVYRNSKTGARATKRMVERNGKKSARYVKLS